MISMSRTGLIEPSTCIIEATDDLQDSVGFPDIGQKLVAQTLALAGALHETGDIDEVDGGVDDFLGAGNFGQLVQPFIGNRHHGLVRLDGAERIVCRFGVLLARQCIEDGRLADIRQPNDTYT